MTLCLRTTTDKDEDDEDDEDDDGDTDDEDDLECASMYSHMDVP